MASLQPLTATPSALRPEDLPTDSYALLQVMLGASHISAGEYPPGQQQDSSLLAARSLRELDLSFTDAHDAFTPLVVARRERRRRDLSLAAMGLAAALVAGCIGAGCAWMVAADAARTGTAAMAKSEWRIVNVTPGMVSVQVGGRFWPVRQGELLPNGERVVMIDESSLSVTTESGTFRLAPFQPQPAASAAAAPSLENP